MPLPLPLQLKMSEIRARGSPSGIGPSWQGSLPLPAKQYKIGGVIRDSSQVVQAGVTVDLFLSASDTKIDTTTSDANGVYAFLSAGPSEFYYCVAYLAGAPDKFATTLQTLQGF